MESPYQEKKLLALAMIVKGDDKEAELLDRCLQSVGKYVDKIFITITRKPGETLNLATEMVCIDHDAVISEFEWCNDFAKARNFNFSQVPKSYEYIMWCDADDIWRGLEKLRPTLEENPKVDAFAFWYMYDFDEYRQPTVVHKKTQIVRNDGCVEWAGKLHEDFKENRSIEVQFVEGIERMHLTTEERVITAQKRNVEVSLGDAKENPNDPRVYWNLANSYLGANDYQNAFQNFTKFINGSDSHEEKYLAQMRIGMCWDSLGVRDEAINSLRIAIGMRPDYPDAYLQLGYIHFKYDELDLAGFYTLKGLQLNPPYHTIMVYNPRDYDYNPMMLLSKIYFKQNRPDLALVMLKGCLKVYPENTYIAGLVKEMEAEKARQDAVLEIVNKLNNETDIKKIKKELDKIPADLASHPAICVIRNKHFVKTESTGKDLVYYCGLTQHEWNPDLFQTKGFGGSEEAVYNLAKKWAKKGWNVTVYNNCGTQAMLRDGVTYRPFWEWNHRDKQDVTILWRSPKALDYPINCSKIYVDLHDVVAPGEFTEKRIAQMDGVFVKTKFHRSLFPNVPDEKVFVIPNGQDFELFNQTAKKDPMLIVNTSSPDRSMNVTPELFKRIKEQVPEAKMVWCYGWHNWENVHENNPKMMAWRDQINADMAAAGIENRGRLTQKEVAKLYLEANIMLYPTEFAEIDCITVKKAQAAGCIPVTTDFGALDESVQFGTKIHSEKTKDNWAKDFQFCFGVEDESMKKQFVDAVVKHLKEGLSDRKEMMKWSRKFEWEIISEQWNEVLERN